MRFFSKACCLAVAASAFAGLTSAEELRIRIPDASNMQLYSPDDYTSLVSFSGQAQLQGTVLAVSERKEIDGEQEWQIKLLFKPTAEALKQLPQVRYESEPEASKEQFVTLNFFQKDKQAAAIAAIFGEPALQELRKQAQSLAKEGLLTLEAFRTGVECDSRDFYADLVSFKAESDLSSQQAQALLKKSPQSCM